MKKLILGLLFIAGSLSAETLQNFGYPVAVCSNKVWIEMLVQAKSKDLVDIAETECLYLREGVKVAILQFKGDYRQIQILEEGELYKKVFWAYHKNILR